MNWQQVREQYPHKWVIAEAIKAHNEGNQWLVEQLTVFDTYVDVYKALNIYKQLHQQAPERDYLVVHTDKEHLKISERHWVGIRAAS